MTAANVKESSRRSWLASGYVAAATENLGPCSKHVIERRRKNTNMGIGRGCFYKQTRTSTSYSRMCWIFLGTFLHAVEIKPLYDTSEGGVALRRRVSLITSQ